MEDATSLCSVVYTIVIFRIYSISLFVYLIGSWPYTHTHIQIDNISDIDNYLG